MNDERPVRNPTFRWKARCLTKADKLYPITQMSPSEIRAHAARVHEARRMQAEDPDGRQYKFFLRASDAALQDSIWEMNQYHLSAPGQVLVFHKLMSTESFFADAMHSPGYMMYPQLDDRGRTTFRGAIVATERDSTRTEFLDNQFSPCFVDSIRLHAMFGRPFPNDVRSTLNLLNASAWDTYPLALRESVAYDGDLMSLMGKYLENKSSVCADCGRRLRGAGTE